MPTVPPATKATTSFRCMVVSLCLPSMARFPSPCGDAGGARRSVVKSLESPLAGLMAGNAAALIVGEAVERAAGGADQRHTLRRGDVLGTEPLPTRVTVDHGVLVARDAAAGGVTLRRDERGRRP